MNHDFDCLNYKDGHKDHSKVNIVVVAGMHLNGHKTNKCINEN